MLNRDNILLDGGHGVGISLDLELPPEEEARRDSEIGHMVLSPGSYKVVDRDFYYTAGMYVAIVACLQNGMMLKQMKDDVKDDVVVQEEDFPRYFGGEAEIIVNAGKITFVGETHTEYNINTSGGFSGASVVYLEKVPNFLKAIDAGYNLKKHLGTNLGFKLELAGKLDEEPKCFVSRAFGWMFGCFRHCFHL
jgi:hypothetical protein